MPPRRKRSESPVRPWHDEVPEYTASRPSSWLDEIGVDPPPEPSSDPASDAANLFLEEILDMYLLGKKMSAKHVCTLCHYASLAGIRHAKKYALKPDSPTGHFQRKLDLALDLPRFDSQLYEMEIPGFGRGDVMRSPQTIHVVPPPRSSDERDRWQPNHAV